MSHYEFPGSPVLKMFGSSTCPKCADAKERLKQRKIRFQYHNVGTAKGLAEAAYFGLVDEALPVLILAGQDGELIMRFRAVLQAIAEMERRMLMSGNRQMSIPLSGGEPD
ncbi:hypothetical protein J7M28_13120 [bacterium]|nr:hypothetical protein [bacterium]